jgi:protoporphyrinogen oxidase
MAIKTRFLIIGAGLTGLSTAYHLGRDYIIIEKEPVCGGLASSVIHNGFTFDKTGHLLHFKDPYAKALVNKLCGNARLRKHKRSSWVYSNNVYTKYPFQIHTHGLPAPVIADCLINMSEAYPKQVGKKSCTNFKEWIINNFGKGIAKHFMFPYNKKLWRVPLDTINHDWVNGLIPKTSMPYSIKGAVSDYKKDFGYNRVFYYPQKGGIQVLPDLLLKNSKGRVFFKSSLASLDLKNKKALLKDGRLIEYSKLISTMPLPGLINRIKNCPQDIKSRAKALRHISVYNLNIGIETGSRTRRHWIYFPEKRFIFYRVGFNSNFSEHCAPKGCMSIYTEISYIDSKRHALQKHERINRRVIEDLKKSGILSAADRIITEQAHDIKYGYPLYDNRRQAALSGIQDYLDIFDVYSIGRFGAWRYMSMEECILQGRDIGNKMRSVFL